MPAACFWHSAGSTPRFYPKVVQLNYSYDLANDAWSALPMKTEPSYQVLSAAPVVWTGEKLLHVSGVDQGNNLGMTYFLSAFHLASGDWSQKALGSARTNFCADGYESLWTGKYIAQTDGNCIFDPEQGKAYSLPQLPTEIAVEAPMGVVAGFAVQGERAVWTGKELLTFGGSYTASEVLPDCPEGAPCAGPAKYEGAALGARFTLE